VEEEPVEILVLVLVDHLQVLQDAEYVYLQSVVVQVDQTTKQDLLEDLEVAEVTVQEEEKQEQEQLIKEKEVQAEVSLAEAAELEILAVVMIVMVSKVVMDYQIQLLEVL
jgi:hypothetical protein